MPCRDAYTIIKVKRAQFEFSEILFDMTCSKHAKNKHIWVNDVKTQYTAAQEIMNIITLRSFGGRQPCNSQHTH